MIFSDEYLPTENTIQNYTVYYYEGTQIQFDEKKAYCEAIKNGVFDVFANSFFVEASSKKIKTKVNLENAKLFGISENARKFYDKKW